MKIRPILLCCLVSLSYAHIDSAASETTPLPLYRQSTAPLPARLKDLLSRMTLEEKAAQLRVFFEAPGFGDPNIRTIVKEGRFNRADVPESLRDGIGEMAIYMVAEPIEAATFRNSVQAWATQDTRLGIPVFFHAEAVHGLIANGATVFPQGIALGSTWNPTLIEKISSIAARQARAQGILRVMGPVLDLATEPRWGRIEESYSEDPYLVSRLGVAAVRGFQGPGDRFLHPYVLATAKHFVHGRPERGLNAQAANISERVLRETFFRPFERAVREAQIATIMPSYNEIDGILCSSSPWLLRDVLRTEWGFEGITISDYGAIEGMAGRVAEDMPGAAALALKAGVDLCAQNGTAYLHIPELVRSGRLTMAEVDEAVGRVLRFKFLAGLFENPFVDLSHPELLEQTKEDRAVARTAAEEAIILLKNDAALLPFDATSLKRLAVIGPNADKVRVGGYSGVPSDFVTVLKGIQARIGAGTRVTYAEGVKLTIPDAPIVNSFGTSFRQPTLEDDQRSIAEAVRVAEDADAIVLVLGGNEALAREASSHGVDGDTDDLELPGRQNDLFDAIVATGKPVVVVLLNGRPYSFTHVADRAPAILECWYLGQETGNAIASVLLGDVNPSGKLPVTIARNVGQLPAYYYAKSRQSVSYVFSDSSPLFPFGHGLSYTSFAYTNVRVSRKSFAREETVQVSVDVTNTGRRSGVEIAQLYLHDEISSVTRPAMELKGFDRVLLEPGETRTLVFEVAPDDLALFDREMKRTVEPGWFTVMAGGSSAETISERFEVK